MSTGAMPIRYAYDPKSKELISKVIEKTRAGRIQWGRSQKEFTALAAGRLLLVFDRSVLPPNLASATGDTWSTFTIKEQPTNKEVLKVENTPNVFAILTGMQDPLAKHVSELYALVEGKASGDVEKAINVIDNL